jgi:HAE1 family hydrophobic/amphiphilic exporter-1
MPRPLLLLAVLLLCPAAALAQPLTRAQVVDIALANNPAVLKAADEIARFEGLILEARADALPEVKWANSGLRYRDPGLLNSPNFDSFPPEFRDQLSPLPANVFDTSATIKQTIFSFKLGHAVNAARLGRDFGREDQQRVRQTVALAAVQAYHQLLFARENVRVAEATVTQREEQLQVMTNRREAGVATELDVLRSGVALENARAALARTHGQVELAVGNLNAVMVRPIDAPVETVDTLALTPFDQSLADVIDEALRARPEMKAAALNERIYGEFVGIARGEKRPTFDFNGAFGYSVREPKNLFDNDFTKWSAGVFVNVPVFDGFRANGRILQAQARERQASQDRVAIENQIRLEAKAAYDRLTVARRVLTAADLNVTQAQRALDMTQANLKYGAATLIDLLDAQTALVVAELTRTQALYDHAEAVATLQYVMGRDPAAR